MRYTEGGDLRLPGLWKGSVFDISDPEGRARIRASIPGLTSIPGAVDDSATDWLEPVASFWGPPAEGDEVVVMFAHGLDGEDPDEGYYWPSVYRASQVPVETDGGRPDVVVIERDSYVIAIDNQGSVVIRDRQTGDVIKMDRGGGSISIEATATVNIRAAGTINLDAAVININGVPMISGLNRF